MANEFTLADVEREAPNKLTAAVVRTWREASPVMNKLRFTTKAALNVPFLRWNSLAAIPWRNVGDSFVQTKVTPETLNERPYFIGAKIDIPKEFVIADPDSRKNQEQAAVKGIAYAFNDKFINGLPSDQKNPVGLWYRLVNDFAAGQSVDGGSLDMSPDGAGTTRAFFNLIEDLLSRLGDIGTGSDVALIMNREMKLAFSSAAKASGYLATTKDNLGRQFNTYGEGGPVLMDIGYTYDQSTNIITNVELANGSALTGHDCTSIYAVRFGEPYLAGFQEHAVQVDDVGLLEDRVNYRTVVSWAPGISMVDPRSVARLYGLMAA